ncbi:MAG: hypothetical protein IPO07_30645 [Haliscomenobacter sp.]|nr:hypothetical protein [Haliscomenobacter sp.]
MKTPASQLISHLPWGTIWLQILQIDFLEVYTHFPGGCIAKTEHQMQAIIE